MVYFHRLRLTLGLSLLLAMLLVTPGSAAIVKVAGIIYNDTTWTADDTIRIIGKVEVDDAATLTIEPGALIGADGYVELEVHGRLQALGEADAPIVIRHFDGLGGDNPDGLWYGLDLVPGSYGRLEHCYVADAFYCIRTYNSTLEAYACTLTNFMDKAIDCLDKDGSATDSILLQSCDISNLGSAYASVAQGIYAKGSVNLRLFASSLRHCHTGIFADGTESMAPDLSIESCNISYHANYALYLYACG
jgi:hypothetical protein